MPTTASPLAGVGKPLEMGANDSMIRPLIRVLARKWIPLQRNSASEPIRAYRDRRFYYACKRLFDLFGAAVLLLLLSPLMIVVAILIVVETPGPAIFRQERVGRSRRAGDGSSTWILSTFTIYKFRTMHKDTPADTHRAFVHAFISNDEEAMAAMQGGKTQVRKLVDHPHVTRLGRFLRKSSLDELPQLWNVIKGDMSLVGPRPDVPYSVENYLPWHCERLAVQPGMTGLWQVSGRSRVSFEDWIRMDIEYVHKQSFWLDLKILFLTIPVVLRARGAA